MTGTDLKTVRTRLGLTAPEMADLLAAPLRTYYRWEAKSPDLTTAKFIVTLLKYPHILWDEIGAIKND